LQTRCKIKGVTIECVRGDIADQPDVDAVVNAANAELRPGGGVAGAIHRAAGPGLENECRLLAPIRPGQAVATGAHDLPNRHVIHCLGPIYGHDEPADDLLGDCYRNALKLAEKLGLESIAFPALSTGAFGYPTEAAAHVALKTVLAKLPHLSSVKHVRFVLFDDADQRLHTRVLERLTDSSRGGLALFADLYELRMVQAYFEERMADDAVFSLFVRRLPARRNFLLACGLDTVLDYLENLRFGDGDLAYLRSLGPFSDRFLDWLGELRFTGHVYAVAEGTPVFADEPILEVVAPLPEAQLVETFVMNQIHVQTLLATKAQRVVTAAADLPVVDFGARRMHGIDAALKAARAFYIGGVAATSNLLAGRQFGLPVMGTMAHSYIQAHEDEAAAFRAFAQLYPGTVLLVDTYDTLAAVRTVCDLAKTLGEAFQVKGVRLDSGDLVALSKETRRLLDDAGLSKVEIFASGGLDEYKIAELLSSGAPIDGFGVGTNMAVSEDAPDLDIAYKLCEYAGRGRLKLSASKPILPGRKQVFRVAENHRDFRDVIARADETLAGRPLLQPVMRNGKRLPAACVDLEAVRHHAKQQIARLPDRVRALPPAEPPYEVEISNALSLLHERIKEEAEAG